MVPGETAFKKPSTKLLFAKRRFHARDVLLDRRQIFYFDRAFADRPAIGGRMAHLDQTVAIFGEII